MQGIQISEAKAPWIMFERRAEEDRDGSKREGRYMAKDVDYVLITPHGSKDRIERVVSEWFEYLEQQTREERFEASWLMKFKAAYESWKTGKEVPLDGTPILNWPLVSPAQVRMLQDLHLLTVEALASANEETIRRLGMGGRTLVAKANEFLKQTQAGKSTEEVVTLKVAVEGLQHTVEAQREQINTLMAQLKSNQVAQQSDGIAQVDLVRQDVNSIGVADLIDTSPAKAKKL